jgi:hypothetical protein
MLHYATLFELEMRCIESMSRQQLLESVQERADCLPDDLLQGWEGETTENLQLMLLAARFIRALRQLRRPRPQFVPKTN